MNLVEKIKARQDIDPIEVFDISDTKEIVENNYNAFVNEINQMKIDEQKRIEQYNKNFTFELEEAKKKDKKFYIKTNMFFWITLIIMLSPSLIKQRFNVNVFQTDALEIMFTLIFALICFISFCMFWVSNEKDKVLNKFKKEKNIGSLTNKINLYIFILMELTELCKLFNNQELKQSEIVSNILALKTNYETRKFQQEMLNKRDQEIELQRKIAEYNRQQVQEQQRQTEYARQQMQSQQRQEDLVRQEQQRRNNRY